MAAGGFPVVGGCQRANELKRATFSGLREWPLFYQKNSTRFGNGRIQQTVGKSGLQSAVLFWLPSLIRGFFQWCKQRKMVVSRTDFMPIGFLLCLAIAGGTGCCSWTDKSGTRHVLVVGVGVVSVNNSKPSAAIVTSMHALGVAADQGGVTAGYSSRFTTAVPDGAEDVRIEASQRPFAPIKIEVQKTQLSQTNQTRINKE